VDGVTELRKHETPGTRAADRPLAGAREIKRRMLHPRFSRREAYPNCLKQGIGPPDPATA
jgi:hypothetical protein